MSTPEPPDVEARRAAARRIVVRIDAFLANTTSTNRVLLAILADARALLDEIRRTG